MSKVLIKKSSLNGTLALPPSKSAAHRALICSFLAGGGAVSPIINSNDMKATVGVIESLKSGEATANCLESGSTMRFMIPVAAALGKEITFTGEGSLLSRTAGEYIELLPKHGVTVESNGFLPLKISGRLKCGNYEVNGNVSSQYITGLLFALSVADGDSAIILKTPLQSKPYVDMTLKVMADYGVNACETDFGYLIHGNQKYAVRDYTVEGDWSHAAFFMSAAAIGGEVTLTGVDFNSAQGDKAVVDVIRRFGAVVETGEGSITCKKGKLHGIEIDCTDIPDMVPAIAVTAAFAQGKTVIKGAERLRLKESNRIKSVVENLNKMGVSAQETQDGMIITPCGEVHGAELCGYNDHRIVMAFSAAGLFAKGETVITDAESINKSYPSFFEDYNKLGGKANVINLR
ncbi:MAG: 3-phosphoshikimate 1-carboxyvinyltransferase [Eubacterium sp.]|nr:3-phosphoshikimate 1-carboxyvinyltransferase [Eubacterium sp.]